ncbi:hypothetical protein OUZ56_009465 [Daphnia magna]|uniref:Uncharacterized protein n=1 Tax=Daphnia magna TaxID=35525 RepID=A0ABR0AG17_9CRUS|nr:hypothetical protein OUZ56_009465 [Daphnia magna]
MSDEMCSVARLLNLKDCNSVKMRVLKCFTKTENIVEFSYLERDLLLFRSGLKLESASTICPYHQNYFLISNTSYFSAIKTSICYNPFELHENNRKGFLQILRPSFNFSRVAKGNPSKISLEFARACNCDPKLKPGSYICVDCRKHATNSNKAKSFQNNFSSPEKGQSDNDVAMGDSEDEFTPSQEIRDSSF